MFCVNKCYGIFNKMYVCNTTDICYATLGSIENVKQMSVKLEIHLLSLYFITERFQVTSIGVTFSFRQWHNINILFCVNLRQTCFKS